jgi:ADP-ribose pyrophosphatase YjhB (NUDIX family)
MKNYIEKDLYNLIIENVIVLCTDILVKYKNKYVLLRRAEEPMKNVLWPIGGRIRQSETAITSATRKLKEELGITNFKPLKAIGYYEDHYNANSFKDNTDYYTLSIVFETEIESIDDLNIDYTSIDFELQDKLPEQFIIKPFIGIENE